MERAGHGVHQHGEGRPAPQATRLPQREEALDPAIALLVVAAMHHPAPEHGEPQGPLGPIIGGLHSGFHHERPQGPHLPLQRAGKLPGFVRSRTVLVQQPDHPRIPGLHGAGGRRCRGPVYQPLQLGQHTAAKTRPAPGPSAPRVPARGGSDAPNRSAAHAATGSTPHSRR